MLPELFSMNVYLFIALIFVTTFVIGHLSERIKVPWIFSALILGAVLAWNNPFAGITSSPQFIFLALLGQYFLLFIIGFEIDLREIKERSAFIVESTIFVITIETLFGTLLFRYLFGASWFTSFLVSMSFATIGEGVLIPVLDEVGIVNTLLGQTIIGIGTLDDIAEVVALVVAVALIGSAHNISHSIPTIAVSLIVLLAGSFILFHLHKMARRFGFSSIESLFLFIIFILFLFVGIGDLAESASLGALLAGIALGNFIPRTKLSFIKSEVRALCYGFFAPLFLFWVGTTLDMRYLFRNPLPVLLVAISTTVVTVLAMMAIGRKTLGLRDSIIAGIGASVRFSTSIVIFKILYENHLISTTLYSALIAASVLVTFAVPLMFSQLITRWKGRPWARRIAS